MKRESLALPFVLFACASPLAAEAQDASAAAAADGALEPIIVTSQKRREDVKEVPLSVSAIGGDALRDLQIADYDDLSRSIPNVSFMSQAGLGLSTLEIRGVTSQAGSATVGVYLDDVSLTTRNLYSMGVAEPQFFDIDRVEVLRGPQGTLYGAGSMGGTIRFIGNRPDPGGFAGTAATQLSTTEHGGTNFLAQGVLNVPVNEVAAVRVGIEEGSNSGYIDQVSPRTLQILDRGIDSDAWSVEKLAALVRPTSGWTVVASVFAQQYRMADIDAAYLNVPFFQVGNGQGAVPGPTLPIYETSKDVREPGDDRLTVSDLTVTADLQATDLTFVYGNYRRRFGRIQDGSEINSNYLAFELLGTSAANLVAALNALPSAIFLDNAITTNSIELRLSSKDYEPARAAFTWVAGAFEAHTRTDVDDNEPVFGITQLFQSAGVPLDSTASPLAGSFPGAFGAYPYGSDPDSSYFSARHYDDEQFSLFGELTAHLGSGLRLVAGLRWLDADEVFDREGAYYFTDGPPSAAHLTTGTTGFTPRFALDWDADAQTTLYANIARGLRTGGANRPIPLFFQVHAAPAYVEPQTFGADSLWSYEAGSKSRLLERRVSLDLAAYLVDWRNIQQDVNNLFGGFDYETNTGSARITGFELESRYNALPGLTLSASGNWTRAVFTADVPLLGLQSGQEIQGVPKYSLDLGMQDRFAAGARSTAVLRWDGQWTGPSYGTWLTDSPDYLRPAYFTCSASAALNFGRWEFGAFAKNLNDNRTIIQRMPIQDLNEALYLRPRTIGVSLTASI